MCKKTASEFDYKMCSCAWVGSHLGSCTHRPSRSWTPAYAAHLDEYTESGQLFSNALIQSFSFREQVILCYPC